MDQILPFVPGALMGFGMAYAKVSEGAIMVGQMTFSHFVLLKMFMAGLASSALVHGYYFQTKCTQPDEREKYFQRNSRSLKAVLIGCAIVGAGMTMSLSCPGTVYAQLGSLSLLAVFTLLGGIFGALIFENFQGDIFKLIDGKAPEQPAQFGVCAPQPGLEVIGEQNNALYKVLNTQFKLNLTPDLMCYYMSGALFAMVLMFEVLIPWKSDLKTIFPQQYQDLSFPFDGAPPLIAGLFIGCAQYLSLFHLNKQLGCSYTFVEVAQLAYKHGVQPFESKIPPQILIFLSPPAIKSPQTQPMPTTAIGIAIGAFLASVLTRCFSVGRAALDFPPVGRSGSGFLALIFLCVRLFIGGILVVLGARISAGCTSGIGISYFGAGSTTGALGTAVMFGAAIGLGIFFALI